MNKALLRALPVHAATEAERRSAARYPVSKFFLHAEMHARDGTDVLCISVFDAQTLLDGVPLPDFRIFFAEDEYITQDFSGDGSEWLTGTMARILSRKFSIWQLGAMLDDTSPEIMARFFGCKPREAETKMRAFQETHVEKRRLSRYQEIIDSIDRKMDGAPDLPDDFSTFIERNVVKDRFLFYEYDKSKRQQTAFCTGCHQEVQLEKTRHGKEDMCPACGCKAIQKAKVRANGHVQVSGNVGIPQRAANGGMVRLFNYKFRYGDYRSPTLFLHEYGRLYLPEKGEFEVFDYGEYPPQTGHDRWRYIDNDKYFYDVPLYPADTRSAFLGTRWEYAPLHDFLDMIAKSKQDNRPYFGCSSSSWTSKFLEKFGQYPQLEYMMRKGLHTITKEIVVGHDGGLNRQAKSIHEFLGISTAHMKIVNARGFGLNEIKHLRFAEAGHKILTEDEVSFYFKVNRRNHYEPEYPNLSAMKALPYTTTHQIRRYITERINKMKNTPLSDWIDYLDACKKLGFDMTSDFVLFPRDLKRAHDEAVSAVSYKAVAGEEKAYQRRRKVMVKMYETDQVKALKSSDYCIVVPKDLREIIFEGKSLRHCVGGYVKEVAHGERTILFLRKKKNVETPFFTMEIRNDKITQCRGMRNSSMPADVKAFASKYEALVLKAKIDRKAG